MEMIKFDVEKSENDVAESVEEKIRELGEFQLALVGGGIGEVIVG